MPSAMRTVVHCRLACHRLWCLATPQLPYSLFVLETLHSLKCENKYRSRAIDGLQGDFYPGIRAAEQTETQTQLSR